LSTFFNRSCIFTFIDYFIDDTAYECFIKEDLDGFLESRSDNMFRYLKDIIGISIEAAESQTDADREKVEDDLI